MLGSFLSILGVLLLATCFIISAGSGTVVLCILVSGGSAEPPQWIRVLWGRDHLEMTKHPVQKECRRRLYESLYLR